MSVPDIWTTFIHLWLVYYYYYYYYYYEACPESKGTKILNMYKILKIQKRHCE